VYIFVRGLKMRQIVSMWRLILRKILTALMGATAFLFGACDFIWTEGVACEYGVPPLPPPEPVVTSDVISGTVKDANGTPVPGFWVSVLNENPSSQYTFTYRNGKFELYVPRTGNCCYTLFFQDVDGPLNGEFESQTVQYCIDNGPLNIVLKPKETEPKEPGCKEPDPVEPDPVEPDPVEPDPVRPHPDRPKPVRPHPVRPHPVEPEPPL
jgi:hypothetical protein